ncbi:NAD(P)-dependent oxidoreductase [Pseudolabrys taiwanensis]|uniref:NAD(P)-dependent oxidoreductase n=1 Tax=Pseudolabrys taiwanensis TaxID=331696 RepID=A0A345ZQ56_9HYPH|nr:NAD(P)-dependent oxidoreductase [Pseudolabrys taiwanensis]AXK79053.1 NAD(P)-dependent oxidoreductase [Pseudolabrys taiwanensis]
MADHVVVTGASGFAGGFIARALAEKGFTVTALSRHANDDAPVANLRWRRADIIDPGSLPTRFDALLHIAAEIPARCPEPDALYRRNLEPSRSVFEQAVAAGAKTIVFTSSMSVYGSVDVSELTETTPSQNPDPYGRAKRDAEDLLENVVQDGKCLSGLSLRLPGTVGKGSHHNFLSEALRRVLAGEAVRASNPEAMFNNIVYIGDLASFLARWIAAPRSGYAVTNLASPDPIPIRDVFGLLFSTARRSERIEIAEGGKRPFLINLDRAIALGYRPRSVRASIEAFVRDNLTDRPEH